MGLREHPLILQYSWITRMVDTRANSRWHRYQIYPICSQGGEMLKFDSKLWFCETLKSWRDSVLAWRDFWIRSSYLGSYILNRGVILSVPVYYLSVLLQIFWESLSERNLDCKGGNFRVESLCREVLLCKGNIKNTLESENHWVSFI